MLLRSFLFLYFVLSVASNSDDCTLTTLTKISPEIVKELKDFTNLIPQATIDEIVAKHYIIDGNFREVIKYLRSVEFAQLLDRAQQLPEAIEILQFLHLFADSNNDDNVLTSSAEHCQITEAPEEVEILLLDEETPQQKVPNGAVGTFSSFVEELMQHLPRSEYVQLITQKRVKNAIFAQFYTALRSAQLRPMIDAALKKTNVIDVLKPLRANGIDVKSLEATVFKVISWGPAV